MDFVKKEYCFSAIETNHLSLDEQRYRATPYLPVNRKAFLASSKMGLTSLIPTIVADSSLNIEPVCLATSLASVVFPQLIFYIISQ